MRQAQSFKGFCNRGIGIFSQPDPLRAAIDEGFFQLFCTHNNAFIPQIRNSAALPYFTIFLSIHTKTYYTHFFEKVNKNIRKISNKLLGCQTFSYVYPHNELLYHIVYHRVNSFPAKTNKQKRRMPRRFHN